MRGFRLKIAWQRCVLEAVNDNLSPQEQLPGLTQRAVAEWGTKNREFVSTELCSMILQASKLTDSINDFSVPVNVPIEEAENDLKELCAAIRRTESLTKRCR